MPGTVHFGRAICCDLEQASRREWWLANGLGGYAGGTIALCLTRRYHGLLIAPASPPLERMLIFAKADATLYDCDEGGRSWPLFTNCWGSGSVEPQGLKNLESFRLDGSIPVWHFAIGDHIVEQRIWMQQKRHATCIAWRLARPTERSLHLGVDLLVNCRSHHGESHPHEFNPVVEGGGNHISVQHLKGPTLHFRTEDGQLSVKHQWINDFDLARERERGFPDRDSHLCAAHLRLQLGNEWSGLVASMETCEAGTRPHCAELLQRRRAHDTDLLATAGALTPELRDAPSWVRQLVVAADSFLIVRSVAKQGGKKQGGCGQEGKSVIAGYPWFSDWGRDTMIALPGLTLATGRHACARNILTTFSHFIDRGMLPNMFPDNGGQPQYNTVDGALWYFEAWRAYIEVSHDLEALREIYPLLEEIVDWHTRGTRHDIGLDSGDGLLHAGEPGMQLTWMDAKLGDWVITPRHGKPVEINALWYNALICMKEFSNLLGKTTEVFGTLSARAHAGFSRFLKSGSGGLYDVLDGPSGDDASVRPNQILAVSLPHSPLAPEVQARVVAEAGRYLLTSYALRSLAPDHPDYRPCYGGNVQERDSAYHQGTAWAWLLPHYAWAEYGVTGNVELAQSRLNPIRDHLLDAGLGTVSEIFDGEPPHAARGAPSQAWSVACVLDTWIKLERARRGTVQEE